MPRATTNRQFEPALVTVNTVARTLREERELAELEARTAVEQRVAPWREALEDAVVKALLAGYSIADVARAYTQPGRVPNREKIYEIRNAHPEIFEPRIPSGDKTPYRWIAREVVTSESSRTVYDIEADFNRYGPEEISGVKRFRYVGGEVEPFGPEDVLPDNKFYRDDLYAWLAGNPQPGEG